MNSYSAKTNRSEPVGALHDVYKVFVFAWAKSARVTCASFWRAWCAAGRRTRTGSGASLMPPSRIRSSKHLRWVSPYDIDMWVWYGRYRYGAGLLIRSLFGRIRIQPIRILTTGSGSYCHLPRINSAYTFFSCQSDIFWYLNDNFFIWKNGKIYLKIWKSSFF